jgi:hypothetical protein
MSYKKVDEFESLVAPPLVIVVTRTPAMFEHNPNLKTLLKTLVEQHAKTVEGVEFSYYIDHIVNNETPDSQSECIPIAMRRTPVTPVFTFQELEGNIIWNLFDTWIKMIIDSAAHTSFDSNGDTTTIDPVVSMDIMCIQFDDDYRPENIIDAWYIKNMWPKETGKTGWKRTIGEMQCPERIIPFTGTVEHSPTTKADGVKIAMELDLGAVNYRRSDAVDFSNITS